MDFKREARSSIGCKIGGFLREQKTKISAREFNLKKGKKLWHQNLQHLTESWKK